MQHDGLARCGFEIEGVEHRQFHTALIVQDERLGELLDLDGDAHVASAQQSGGQNGRRKKLGVGMLRIVEHLIS